MTDRTPTLDDGATNTDAVQTPQSEAAPALDQEHRGRGRRRIFGNVLADLAQYRTHCGNQNWSLARTAAVMLYSHPASAAVFLYRFGNWAWHFPVPVIRTLFKLIYALLLPAVRLYSGVQIHPCTEIGKGLAILHYGGVVLCRECRIGECCVLHHNVNVVTTNSRMAARIGDYFYAGVGTTIVGNLVIEDNVICGAGSIVTKSVPANAIIGGAPARIIRFRRDNEKPPVYVRGHHEPAPFL